MAGDSGDSVSDRDITATDVASVLRPLEEIESLMREMYLISAERFSDNETASKLFSRLAFEESSHMAAVHYLRRLTRQSKAPLVSVQVDMPVIDFELTRLRTVIPVLPEMGVSEVLEFALACEQGVAEMHLCGIIASANPGLAGLLHTLGQADKVHAARLEALLALTRRAGG